MDKYSIQNCRLGRIYGDIVECGFTSGLTVFESAAGSNHAHLTCLSPLDFNKWTSFWFILLKKITKDQKWKLKTIACSSPIRIWIHNFYELYLANIWRHVWSLNCGHIAWILYCLINMVSSWITNRNFTIKMALLSLEQLLWGVFVIAVSSTIDVGTPLDDSIC